jgi:MHS family shikimate/dehydroshikimate transporter-like MFS transporter
MGRRGAAGGRKCAQNKKAFYSSGVQVGYGVGLLLSTGLVSLISANTTDEQFLSWGWRLPFLFSVVLVLVALWIRNGMAESPNLNSSSRKRSCRRPKSACRSSKPCSVIPARFY